MTTISEPLLTDTFERVDRFLPDPETAYVFAESIEKRSNHIRDWATAAPSVKFVRVDREESTSISLTLNDTMSTLSLRSDSQQQEFWRSLGITHVYLDITGLSHHVWAPLLKSALLFVKDVSVVYVEPHSYTYDPAPTEGQIFDLSERIHGIRPLPGFASLNFSPNESSLFIPLLGFEGRRLSYVLEQIQPNNDKIIPIIGIPGFRMEYPFHTYLGNKRPLQETGAWHRARYAIANCPFDLFYLLSSISNEYPKDVLKIALIGTKPHALGAILFKLATPIPVEIVYDHPIRKPGRTSGSDRLFVYHVSTLTAGRK